MWPGDWANGIYSLVETWDFSGDYLWDGQQGDFVILWTSDPTSEMRNVHGRYRAAGSEQYLDAILLAV